MSNCNERKIDKLMVNLLIIFGLLTLIPLCVQTRDLLAAYTDVQNDKSEMLYYQKNYLNTILEKHEQKDWTPDDKIREEYILRCLGDAVVKFQNSVLKYNWTAKETSELIITFLRWYLKKGISDSPPPEYMEETITLKAGNQIIKFR